jgi:hypothetical protein
VGTLIVSQEHFPSTLYQKLELLLSSRLSRALEYILKIPLHFPNLQILYNTNDSCGEVAVLKEQNKTRNQNEIFETKGARKYI